MDRCAVVPAVGWSHRAAAWYTYHRALSLFSHLLSIILGTRFLVPSRPSEVLVIHSNGFCTKNIRQHILGYWSRQYVAGYHQAHHGLTYPNWLSPCEPSHYRIWILSYEHFTNFVQPRRPGLSGDNIQGSIFRNSQKKG